MNVFSGMDKIKMREVLHAIFVAAEEELVREIEAEGSGLFFYPFNKRRKEN